MIRCLISWTFLCISSDIVSFSTKHLLERKPRPPKVPAYQLHSVAYLRLDLPIAIDLSGYLCTEIAMHPRWLIIHFIGYTKARWTLNDCRSCRDASTSTGMCLYGDASSDKSICGGRYLIRSMQSQNARRQARDSEGADVPQKRQTICTLYV